MDFKQKTSFIGEFDLKMNVTRTGRFSITIRGSNPDLMGALWEKNKEWLRS